MPRCAIYARFSSDMSRPTSAEDQVRICRARADREGWTVTGAYSDLAISGADNRRPGMTQLLSDAAAGSFDLVLAEDLDRVSRDMEDGASIFKRLSFAGVKLVTLSDGEINEMHIGLKGTMNALELQKLAHKIRRGQSAAVARGRVSGGICYGYDVTPLVAADGTIERGIRRINEGQAAVVRRIFADYVAGASPKAIAHALNRAGIPSARGGEWRAPAITGSKGRAIGVLRNPIYVGRYVYNRVRMLRDPQTRNRVSRLNDVGDRQHQDMPELAIVDETTWNAAQELLEVHGDLPAALRPMTRPRRLLSGLVRCGECGGNYTVASSNRWGCSRHREAGTCANGRRIGTAELEERVLAGLKLKLLSPEAVALLVREYHLERQRQAKESERARAALDRRLGAATAAIERLVDAIADGAMRFEEIEDRLRARRAERDDLKAQLAEIEAMPVIALHPQIAEAYRVKIRGLTLAVGQDPNDETLAQQIRALIDVVVVTPRAGTGSEIEVLGSLQAVLEMAENKRPTPKGAGRMFRVVAEEGLEPPTRGL